METASSVVMGLALGFACAMMDGIYQQGLGGILLCAIVAGAAALAAGSLPRRLATRMGAGDGKAPVATASPYCMIATALALLPFLFMEAPPFSASHIACHALLALALCLFFALRLSEATQSALQRMAACALAVMAGWVLGLRAFAFAQLDSVPLHMTTAAFVAVLALCALLLSGWRTRDGRATMAARQAPATAEERTSPDAACGVLARQAGLSRREEEVLSLLAQGQDAHGIEQTLLVSRNTVKTHLRNVYAKLGVHSRDELMRRIEAERGSE